MTFEKEHLLCLFAGGEKEEGREKAKEASLLVAEFEHKMTCSRSMPSPIGGEDGVVDNQGRESSSAKLDRGGSHQSSPRTVLDVIVSSPADSDTSSTCSGAGEATGPDGTPLESYSHQWRALISGLLQRKRSVRRLPTFPPAAAAAAPGTLRRKLQRALSTKDDTDGGCPPRLAAAGSLRRRLQKVWSAEEDAGGGCPPLPLAAATPPPQVCGKPSWRSFEYKELATATDGFSSENLIGKGGHAEVYRGCLPDGQLVAVKRLMKKETEEERIGDFLSELGIIAHVHHPNAAHLVGFGVEGGLHLVLQYSPHGSLASVLHGSKEWIGWEIRFKIAVGIAEGLRYLHQDCHRRIIHRDIKASNILLTDEYQPQISDFGLAKWLPEQWTHHVMFPIEGTFGYLAPEYFMHGVVNEKTDVFAFGVLLLELITGRRAVDSCRQSLVIWAKPLLDANNKKDLIDPSLGDAYEPREMNNAIAVASMCIHHMSTLRPPMDQVLQLMKGGDAHCELNKELKTAPNKPLLFDACDLEDYTCSRYLTDLSRHKQLALEQ